MATPKATFDGVDLYPTLYLKAAAYAYHIAESQAFIDGNKRTALDAALTFLAVNNIEISSEQMVLYDAMIRMANHQMSKEALADLLKKLTSND